MRIQLKHLPRDSKIVLKHQLFVKIPLSVIRNNMSTFVGDSFAESTDNNVSQSRISGLNYNQHLLEKEEQAKVHAFVEWMNIRLKKVPISSKRHERWKNLPEDFKIDEQNFSEDLHDGRRFLILAESLTKKAAICETNSTLRVSKLLNVQNFIKEMEEFGRRNFVNIRASDIVDQNRKILLALMWNTIIAANNNGLGQLDQEDQPNTAADLMKNLLKNIQQDLKIYPDGLSSQARNYTTGWQNGELLAGLLHKYGYWTNTSWDEIMNMTDEDRVNKALEIINKNLKVPEMVSKATILSHPEKQSMYVYINEVYSSLNDESNQKPNPENEIQEQVNTLSKEHENSIDEGDKLLDTAKQHLDNLFNNYSHYLKNKTSYGRNSNSNLLNEQLKTSKNSNFMNTNTSAFNKNTSNTNALQQQKNNKFSRDPPVSNKYHVIGRKNNNNPQNHQNQNHSYNHSDTNLDHFNNSYSSTNSSNMYIQIVTSPYDFKHNIKIWFNSDYKNCSDYLDNLNSSQSKLEQLSPQYLSSNKIQEYHGKLVKLQDKCEQLESYGKKYLEITETEIQNIEYKDDVINEINSQLEKANELCVNSNETTLEDAYNLIIKAESTLKNKKYTNPERRNSTSGLPNIFDPENNELDRNLKSMINKLKHNVESSINQIAFNKSLNNKIDKTEGDINDMSSLSERQYKEIAKQERFRRMSLIESDVNDLKRESRAPSVEPDMKRRISKIDNNFSQLKNRNENLDKKINSENSQIVWEVLNHADKISKTGLTSQDEIKCSRQALINQEVTNKELQITIETETRKSRSDITNLQLEKEKLLKNLLPILKLCNQKCNYQLHQEDFQKKVEVQNNEQDKLNKKNKKLEDRLTKLDAIAERLISSWKNDNSLREKYLNNSQILSSKVKDLNHLLHSIQGEAQFEEVMNELNRQTGDRELALNRANLVKESNISDVNIAINTLEMATANPELLENALYDTLKKVGKINDQLPVSDNQVEGSSLISTEERNRLLDNDRALRQKLKMYQDTTKELEKDLNEAYIYENEAKQYQKDIQDLNLKIKQLNEEIARYKIEAEEMDDNIRYMKDEKKLLERNLDNQNERNNTLLTEIDVSNDTISNLKQNYEKLKYEFEQKVDEKLKLEREHSILKSDYSQVQKSSKNSEEKLKTEYAELQNNLLAESNGKKDLEKEISELNAEINELNNTIHGNDQKFNVERDELNWTIKLLKKQAEENQREASHYADLKRQSDQQVVKAIDKQRELEMRDRHLRI